MAKKGVVIFDGEDKFVAKKKHVYSKSKGQAKSAKEVFLGVRADMEEGVQEPVQSASEQTLSQGSTPAPQQVITDETIGGATQAVREPVREPIISTPIGDIPSLPQISIPPIIAPSVEDDRKSTNPVFERPVLVTAPTPELPTWSTGTVLTTTTQPFFGDEGNEKLLRNPGGKPIFDDRLPGDGIPSGRPVVPWNPAIMPEPPFVEPTPIVRNPVEPPATIIMPPPIDGGKDGISEPVIPRPKCPVGFVYNETTGMCIDKTNPDKEIDPIQTILTTSTTTSTTTKAKASVECPNSIPRAIGGGGCPQGYEPCASNYSLCIPISNVNTTTTSTTTSTTTLTTTAAPSKGNCQPPIYKAPTYYKWVDKGDCKWELQVDQVALPNAAPAPVLPIVTLPIVSTTNAPATTTSTIQTTTTKSPLGTLPGGGGGASGGGGGGGEEAAPTQEAPKKNYFWWYVGGALAIYLILKKKKK